VKKQSAKQPKTGEKIEVSHLDATLTEITATTAERLKKWRKPLIGGVVAVFGIALVYSLLSAFAESREESFNEHMYTLLGTPAAQKEGYSPDREEVSKLLEDVRGNRAEAFVLKTLANFYVDQADTLSDKAKKAAEDATKTPAGVEEARDQALKIADEAVKRFANDADLQHWATAMKSKIEGDRKTGWLPPKWKYTPPQPKTAENAGTAAATAPGTPSPPASEALKPASPEPETKK